MIRIIIIITIILSLNQPLMSYSGNGINITGKVIDAITKEPLVGANVIVKMTNFGTATDINGYFELRRIAIEKPVLIISMVGYQSIIYTVVDKIDNITFELKPALIEMGSIVVTGTNSLHLYENTSVKTEIVPKKLIQQQNACNLAQALGLQTGVMVENDCNNCNFTQVRILGFDGKYSQILIDGDPVISSLGGVYGLEHYPQEMIEQIEIVKGGGSALYGGGAVAGTINMMTRRPAFNGTKVYYNGYWVDGSPDNQIGAIAEIVSNDNKTGIYVFGSTRNRGSYDRNGDGYSELGKLKNETIGFNGYLRPDNYSELQFSLHRIVEDRRGGGDFDKPVHEASIAEWTKHDKWGGKVKWNQKIGASFEYKINYAFSLLERNSYYGGLSDNTPESKLEALKYYGYSDNPLYSIGMQANYYLSGQIITAGIQYNYDKLLDKSVSNDKYYVDEIFRNFGFYLQDEISFDSDEQLQIVAGVRFDKHSALSSWIFSPRLNAKMKLWNALNLRMGFTTGFKAPQIFNEDLHICGLEGMQRVIRNSTGLKEEKSYSYTFGAEFQDFVGNIPLLSGITLFYTRLSGAYSEEFVATDGAVEYWERINSSGANVKGIEIDFGIKPLNKLEIRSGFTFKKNEFDDIQEDYNIKEFLRTPDIFGYIRIAYDYSDKLSFFTAAKYTGKMYVPHEISVDYQENPLIEVKRSKEFIEFDFSLNYQLELMDNLLTQLSLGVKNIFDQYQNDLDYGVNRDPGYVYGPSYPRTFYINLGLKL
ncbi:TonB-dependent receptor [Melioribacter sp. OK-6-Me]|uniref:TonB-dependent receptor n=1 Tax=unclassified Melioribacter TaxID=2627329 RepID=UPI003ED96552